MPDDHYAIFSGRVRGTVEVYEMGLITPEAALSRLREHIDAFESATDAELEAMSRAHCTAPILSK